jgi:formylglycine-generating enzyme required for sulfatase activity
VIPLRRLALGTLLAASLIAEPASSEPAMAQVPAGEHAIGSTVGDPDERPVHRVKLASFTIDRHETTQAEYARCVAAGTCRAARRYPEAEGARLPVVGVSHADAIAYCRWAGKRLPSEAEWERAARGSDGRRFPWGDSLDCSRANFGSFIGDGPCGGVNPGRPLPVGSRPTGVSSSGVHDLAGNVWEWVADEYRPYPGGTITPPANPGGETLRVVRGGSCCSYFAMPTTTNRLAFPAGYLDRDLGFRCAR